MGTRSGPPRGAGHCPDQSRSSDTFQIGCCELPLPAALDFEADLLTLGQATESSLLDR